MNSSIYFDNNATTFLDPIIKEKLKKALDQSFGNPSSPHSYGQAAKAILSEARREIASYLKVNQSQIIFTSGGTEGAVLCMNAFIDNTPSVHVISSEIEHACVFDALKKMNVHVTYLPVDLTGAINPDDLKKAITSNTKAIVLMAANNETGVKQDLEAISQIAEFHKIPLIVDGVSYLGKEPIKIPSGVSAMFFSGHKIHALQGIGFIYLKKRGKIDSKGAQEFGIRGGTENLLGIISLSEAIKILNKEGIQAIENMRQLRDCLETALLKLPGVKVNGSGLRICNTTNLLFEHMDGEQLLIALDQAGVAVSLGSACSSLAIEPSRVLLAMGISNKEAKRSLRISLSRLNTMEEVEKVIDLITTIYKF